MWVHSLDPVIFSLGPLAVRWYSLAYVLGFLAAYMALKRLLGFSEKQADSLLLWMILGMLLGSRLFFFAFYRPDLFGPLEFFAVWNGGMSFHGGLVGIGAATWWWCRRNNVSFYRVADGLALITPWFLALGRVANFINAEIVGTLTDISWCVDFSQSNPLAEGCRHPVQLYAVLKDVFLGFLLLAIWRKDEKFKEGFVFWLFALGYGVLRFIVNFWRADPSLIGWLKMGHVLSFVLVVLAGWMLIARYRPDLKKLF